MQALPTRLTPVLQHWLRDEDEIPAEFKPQVAPTIPQKFIRLAAAGGGVTSLRENYGASLRILLMVCGTLLLIACANLANLLLARGAARRAQTAVRLALGAARTRLIRQQLTEAVLLSVLGGIAGLGVAYVGARLMLALAFHSATFTPISAAPSLPVSGICVCAFTPDRCAVWRGAGVAGFALRSGRGIARSRTRHSRRSSRSHKGQW